MYRAEVGGVGQGWGDSEQGVLALLLLLPVCQVHELEEQISGRTIQHRQVLLLRRLLSAVAALVQAGAVHGARLCRRKQKVAMGQVLWGLFWLWGKGLVAARGVSTVRAPVLALPLSREQGWIFWHIREVVLARKKLMVGQGGAVSPIL